MGSDDVGVGSERGREVWDLIGPKVVRNLQKNNTEEEVVTNGNAGGAVSGKWNDSGQPVAIK